MTNRKRHRHWRIPAEQACDELLAHFEGDHGIGPRPALADGAAITSANHENESGHGLSPQTAVDVNSVSDEYAWLAQRYPGYQFVKQALCWSVRGWIDVIDIVTAAGEERTIHFRLARGMPGR